MGRHGGGAFSGKDPSKVDRSACYYARYVAKNVVAAGLAKRCEVQIAYAIGVAQPVGVHVNTFGTGKVDDEMLEKYILENFDMRPKALIEQLDLLKPIYKKTAAYGHFGRDEFSWEKTDPRRQDGRRPLSPLGHRRHARDDRDEWHPDPRAQARREEEPEEGPGRRRLTVPTWTPARD